jgi:mono/diheme cytochrome c family protein
MQRMRVEVVAAASVVLGVAAGGAAYAGVVSAARSAMGRTHDVHQVDFPIPFPLTDAEKVELLSASPADPPPSPDFDAIARARAAARGEHLVEARYACAICHGTNFGGGVMVDDAMIGNLEGPNLTTGRGSRTLAYTSADWDRIVRHGVKPDGSASPMPSRDYFAMSDRELSDIVTYIRSLPPVDREVPAPTYGPLGNVLIATGQFSISADVHPTDHVIDHAVEPPAEVADAAFGRHLVLACAGCHRADFTGGPIAGGPPGWPPASNLTQLGSWTYDDFARALREAKRPDGSPLKPPMADMPAMAARMTETEIRAMWAFVRSLPPAPTGT